jgi:tRNA dimethylallyltransferase
MRFLLSESAALSESKPLIFANIMKKRGFSTKPKLIAIVGPTASGKTSLSIALAKKFHGEIVSADSRQVYSGLNIGSGKVAKREMRGIPHHLLDIASPQKIFTVAQFQKQGRRAIQKIIAKEKLPIIVGGTGLYVDALIHSHVFPSVKPNFSLRKKLEAQSTEKLFAQLQRLDPRRAATIDHHNPRRLVRALEIIFTTKQPVPSANEVLDPSSDHDVLILGVSISEKKLRENIHRRLITRLRHGMVQEAERLHKAGVSFKRLETLGLEYRYLGRYLQGKLTKKEMETRLEKEIRRYAKRQMTWFRKNKSIRWIKTQREAEKEVRTFFKTKTYRSADVARPQEKALFSRQENER